MLSLQVRVQLWWLAHRRAIDWRDDAGMTTETVIITAILATLALAAGAIIVAKVTGKANDIPVGGNNG